MERNVGSRGHAPMRPGQVDLGSSIAPSCNLVLRRPAHQHPGSTAISPPPIAVLSTLDAFPELQGAVTCPPSPSLKLAQANVPARHTNAPPRLPRMANNMNNLTTLIKR
ncbi:hypothetical protein BM1_02371 [Bipolaris maydis]|nr:hypothetical protein BM1_02371 [Bipolaris maydis]